MQTESKPEPKKGGRPKGFSPKAAEPEPVVEDDGEWVPVRIRKKELAKLLLKDLI